MRLLDHMVTLSLVFQGTSTLFSTVAAPIYIPTNGAGGSPFYTPSLVSVICRLFFFFFATTTAWGSSWPGTKPVSQQDLSCCSDNNGSLTCCAWLGTSCRLFNDGHSDWREVFPHCSFDLHFSNN